MSDEVGHRKLVGHHGTSRQIAEIILSKGFVASHSTYDWLGDGAYFWQDAPARAAAWAIEKFRSDAAVIEAEIEIQNFVNLLDMEWMSWLAEVHDQYIDEIKKKNGVLPPQTDGAHRLDRAVINFGISLLDMSGGARVGGVIGAFREGRPVFPNSALYSLSHVQIAVRDLSLISNCRSLSMDEVPDARHIEHR